ncbi:MAG TPA: hypothetical protein DEO65_17360 [Bacillus bacterium]|uniref:Uncharacterized protein n=1 Tax=Siminovitchia fordii TaxID=254759 RepID=A0ABQ4K1C5_9BACI|nr:hypothetical protein J1TS3_06610 [Siminovitchia fordii]HBZ11603.1 hypothetical protein [Bacillus sp. (in: firmicutes)]
MSSSDAQDVLVQAKRQDVAPEPADAQDVLVQAKRQDVAPEPADAQDVLVQAKRQGCRALRRPGPIGSRSQVAKKLTLDECAPAA